MRTQVFLISILCLSVCYTSNTNFCVMDAVYHMSESGKRTAMRLSQRSVSGTKQVKVVQTNPTTEVAEVRETLTLVRGSNGLHSHLDSSEALHHWRYTTHGSNKYFMIPDGQKEEWTLYETHTLSCAKKDADSGNEKYEVYVSRERKIQRRPHARRPIHHKRRPAHKRRPVHRKPVIRIKTPWKAYVRKARACARTYNQKRRLFITLRNKIEKSNKNPSKRIISQTRSLAKELRRIRARCSSLRASATRLYRPYFTKVKKLHRKPERLPRFAKLLRLPRNLRHRKRRPTHKKKAVIRIRTPWKAYVRKARACARTYNQKRRAFIALRNKIERSNRNPSKRTIAQARSLIRQLRKIRARCSSFRAKARGLYRPYLAQVRKLHRKAERLPRFTRLHGLPRILRLRKRRPTHNKRPVHRKPVIRIKTPWKAYVRKARQCARNYNQKRRLFVTLRNRIEKSKGKPSKKTMAQAKKLITELRRIRKRCGSLRATARRLYNPYLSQVRKLHRKPERLPRFSALQKLPRLPKDKNGTPFKIFLGKDDANLYNFHKNWYWYYESRYRQVWPNTEGHRGAIKNAQIEYARASYLARTVKGGYIAQARTYLNQIRSLTANYNSLKKTTANMLKQKNYHLKMMKHYWPNPEVPYVKALGLFFESQMRLYYHLVRFRDSNRNFLNWQNTASTNRNPAYLQEMRNWQQEANLYARKAMTEVTLKRRNKALMRRWYPKIGKVLQYVYNYQIMIYGASYIRNYYPRISENIRELVNLRIAYAKSHNRNIYYRRLIQFYQMNTNSLQTELNIAYVDERSAERILTTHFKYLGGWAKFYYSWGIYENFSWLEEWHGRLAVFTQNRYQHFLRLVRVYPRNPTSPIWRAWAEYFRRQYVWHKQRLAAITSRTNATKSKMIREYKKQTPYNKIYFKKNILSRLQWKIDLGTGYLVFHQRALTARRRLYNVASGQLKVNQQEFMTYDQNAINYHTARIRFNKAQYRMFSNLYKNKKIRLNIANEGEMLNREYYFAKDSTSRIYGAYLNLATTLLRQGRSYQAQRKNPAAQRWARVFLGEGTQFQVWANQLRKALQRKEVETVKARMGLVRSYIQYYSKLLPGYQRNYNKFAKLTEKYRRLAEQHRYNKHYRALMYRYLAQRKRFNSAVANAKSQIAANQKIWNNWKKSRKLQRVSSSSSQQSSYTQSESNSSSSTQAYQSSSAEESDNGKEMVVEDLTSYTEVLLKNIMKFSSKRDRRLLENCW